MLESAAICDILLVEDNPGDALLVRLGLQSEASREVSVVNVGDGQEALDYLYRRDKYKEAPRPKVVFLDLNLPKIDGREVLKAVKQDRNLSTIPVVILSTSESSTDIDSSYRHGANSYIVKPRELADTLSTISRCRTYWLDTVRLQVSTA
ncbi:MAG: response regulator [Acidobacteriaceae bacterium]|nr:response regulator [Acidobacteriaceae bacterium]